MVTDHWSGHDPQRGIFAGNHLPAGEIRLFNGLTTVSKNDQARFYQKPLSLQIAVISPLTAPIDAQI
jgi:hypothetical protein